MFTQLLLVIAQIALLITIIVVSSGGGRTVFQRLFNPGSWYTLFYTLWFLVPQLVSIFNRNFVLGFPGSTEKHVLFSQYHLIGFNVAILLGILLVRLLFDLRAGNTPLRLQFLDLRGRESFLLLLFYASGCLATLYLGATLMNSEGMRSELVKSPIGMLATVISFFGVFAMAVFLGHAFYEKRYLWAILTVAALGGAIFFTGARGRLLWPISLAVAYSFCRADRIRIGTILSLGAIGVGVLLIFDPILDSLREGLRHFDTREIREKVMFSNLFMTKRNFDGFANFTVILNNNSLAPDPMVFLKGGRSAFMNHYFPGMLEKGVGFGTTIPGMLWLGGGLKGLLGGGLVYGACLGLLGCWVHRIRTEPMFWSYMFAMTWIAAVGGNFQESLDKMIAISLPGFVWIALVPMRYARAEAPYEPSSIATAEPG